MRCELERACRRGSQRWPASRQGSALSKIEGTPCRPGPGPRSPHHALPQLHALGQTQHVHHAQQAQQVDEFQCHGAAASAEQHDLRAHRGGGGGGVRGGVEMQGSLPAPPGTAPHSTSQHAQHHNSMAWHSRHGTAGTAQHSAAHQAAWPASPGWPAAGAVRPARAHAPSRFTPLPNTRRPCTRHPCARGASASSQ